MVFPPYIRSSENHECYTISALFSFFFRRARGGSRGAREAMAVNRGTALFIPLLMKCPDGRICYTFRRFLPDCGEIRGRRPCWSARRCSTVALGESALLVAATYRPERLPYRSLGAFQSQVNAPLSVVRALQSPTRTSSSPECAPSWTTGAPLSTEVRPDEFSVRPDRL